MENIYFTNITHVGHLKPIKMDNIYFTNITHGGHLIKGSCLGASYA